MATQTIQTGSSIANGNTVTATLDDLDEYDTVYVLVDDTAGGSPAQYDLEYEVSNTVGGSSSMTVASLGSSASPKHTFDAVPYEGTFTLTNSSGGSASFRVRVVAVDNEA